MRNFKSLRRRFASLGAPAFTILAVLIASVLTACKAPQDKASAAAADSAQAELLHFSDTLEFNGGPMEYFGRILYKGKRVVDTLSLGFDMQSIGADSILYVKLTAQAESLGTDSAGKPQLEPFASIVGPYVFDGKRAAKLAWKLPYYDDCFSSPAYFDSALIYWGLKQEPDSGLMLMAYRCAIKTGALDSLPLYRYELGTDNCAALDLPAKRPDGYVFSHPEDALETLVSLDFKTSATRPVSDGEGARKEGNPDDTSGPAASAPKRPASPTDGD